MKPIIGLAKELYSLVEDIVISNLCKHNTANSKSQSNCNPRSVLINPGYTPNLGRWHCASAPSFKPLGLRVKEWYFQMGQGLNPEPRALEQDALFTLPIQPRPSNSRLKDTIS